MKEIGLYSFLLLMVPTILFLGCDKKNVSTDPQDNHQVDVPASAKDGITFLNSGKSVICNIYAPNKKKVYVIGDFNDWKIDAKYALTNTKDGSRWWLQIDNLDVSKEYAYQYVIDDTIRVADPYTEKVLDPNNDSYIPSTVYPNLKPFPTGRTTGIVSTFNYSQESYSWNTQNFVRPDPNKLVIYELLVRDFATEHSYNAIVAKLDYLQSLGVNAIELMPVTEFEGNLSWGYNPIFYFAPDKYYGTKNALKSFIDACHGRGIAVITDMVFNHSYGQSPMVQMYFNAATGKPAADNPWYDVDATHPYNVGYQFNHESAATKQFFKDVVKFWMKEYHLDGFRFDLAKGFTQNVTTDVDAWGLYDPSRVAIWTEYNAYLKSIDPDFYVILEHFAEAKEEQALAAQGMIMWNNLNYNFNEATMGWVGTSDLSWAFYDQHGFTSPGHLVTYMESHDEERITYKNLAYGNVNTASGYSIQDLGTALKRDEEAAAFLFAIPGPKMLWQFGELGYDISIDYNGRTGDKPIHWDYYDDSHRKALYGAYSHFIHLKTHNDIFNTTSFIYNLNGHGLNAGIKYIKLTNASDTVFVVGNFDIVAQNVDIDFGSAGSWYDAANSNNIITLSTSHYAVALAPGEYHILSRKQLN